MKLWRWLRGGHWERWYVNDGANRTWFRLESCSLVGGHRPHSGCLGTPICEDHRR